MKPTTRKSRVSSIIISLLFIFCFQLIPAPEGLSRLSMQVVGIFVGTVVLWLSISTDWPSMLCIAAVAFTSLLTPSEIFALFFGNSTCMFLVFSYMLAYSLAKTGALRRLALWFITRRMTRKHPWVLILMLLSAAMLIGLVIIPSTMILIFLPIMTALFRQCKLKEGERLPEVIVLAVAFTGSIAQGMTPIGHAHPVIAMSVLSSMVGYDIPYARFMAFAIPTGLIVFAAMVLYFRFVVRVDVSPIRNADTEDLRSSLGPISKREKIVLSVFVAVVLCWLAPAVLSSILPEVAGFFNAMGNVMPALVGVIILCIVEVDGEPLCDFKAATRDGVPWGIVFLIGATMVMSKVLTSPEIGLSNWIGSIIGAVAVNLSPLAFTTFIIAAVIILTNFSSNAVTASLVTSLMIPVAMQMTDKINPYAMTAVIGSCVNFAFATPLATAVVAIAAGSDWVTTKNMGRYGATIGLIAIIIFALIGYPLANLVLPYGP